MMNMEWMKLSESPIWRMQRQYFEQQGMRAWMEGEVPSYITNNPVLAEAYAELVFGFMRDWARNGGDVTKPIYVLELGAGSGRFAFYLLKALSFLCQRTTEKLPRFCYIISDLSSSNVEFGIAHERLTPYVEQGMLDFG